MHSCDDGADHNTDDDTDNDTDDNTNDDTNDNADDGGRGNLCTSKVFRGWVAEGSPWGGSRLGRGGRRRPTWTETDTGTNPSAPPPLLPPHPPLINSYIRITSQNNNTNITIIHGII